MKKKILVSGSLVYDKIMDFKGSFADYIMPDKIHRLSLSFIINKIKVNFGGTAGNIAYNLKLLGEEPIILSQAGDDFVEYSKWLKSNKITRQGIRRIKSGNTACAYIITDMDDNQIAALHLETMGRASNITQARINSFGQISLAIVSPGNIKDMLQAVKLYKKIGIKYIADPGQQIPALNSRELSFLIKGAKLLICNDYEMELIKQKINKSIKQLASMLEEVVITYGAQGSIIYKQSEKIKIKAVKPKKVVDPTGAGDAYRAGFIKGLVNNWTLEKCGQLASWVAKHPVEYYGTQEHKFNFPKGNSIDWRR